MIDSKRTAYYKRLNKLSNKSKSENKILEAKFKTEFNELWSLKYGTN